LSPAAMGHTGKNIVALALVLLSCAQAQDRLDNCLTVTKGSELNRIKAVLSDVAQQHTCSNIEPPVDFDNMMDRCEAFCGPNGIPIVVGTDSVGFSLQDIDRVCLGPSAGPSAEGDSPILSYNPAKMNECREWSEALDAINVRAADFIASVRNMTFEQMVYRAAMQEKVTELQVTMQSDEVAEEMDLARADRKLDRLTEILRDSLSDLMGDGMLKRQLESKLSELTRKSELLQTVITRNLPLLERFVEECNDLLLAPGPLNEYVLDLCSVTSEECIESSETEDGVESHWGRHAACCCGVVPSVGQFDIPALGQMSSRRLEEDAPAPPRSLQTLRADQEVDVCGYAYQASAADWDDAVGRLQNIEGGEQTVQDFETGQRAAYADFYGSQCDVALERRLQEHPELTKMELEDLPSDEPSVATVDAERRLQNYLTCEPPSSSAVAIEDTLKVAFWELTESALCKDIVEEDGVTLTTARMSEICSDFCTPTAVPFLLGTTAFGFSQTQLDSVCLSPEDPDVLYNAATVNDCHEKANSFKTLQDRTAAFASALQVLDASKLRFEAEAKRAANALKEVIRNEAQQVLDDATQSQKIVELQRLMRTALDDVLNVNSRVKRRLKEDADTVKERATELQITLDAVLPDISAFLTTCNMMTTGVGSRDEYLLDMCSQTSRECIDGAEGLHVGCCCGYNPVVTLGTSGVAANTATISGLEAASLAGGGRTGRRLQEQTSMDICAEAVQTSGPDVAEHRTAILEMDRADLILRQECERRARYPAFYERCEASDMCEGVEIREAAPSPGAAPASTVTTSSALSKELSMMVMLTVSLIYRPV